jgi:hypothetical protein
LKRGGRRGGQRRAQQRADGEPGLGPAVRRHQQRGHAGQEDEHRDARLGQLEQREQDARGRGALGDELAHAALPARRPHVRAQRREREHREQRGRGRQVRGGDPDGHGEQHVEHSQGDLQDDERGRHHGGGRGCADPPLSGS